MKIKIDFVTNSSSASFLLADTRKDKSKPIRARIKYNGEVYNFNNLIKRLNRVYFKVEDKSDILFKKHYDKLKKYKKNQVNIMIASFSDDDWLFMEGIVQENIRTRGIIVLEGKPSYSF